MKKSLYIVVAITFFNEFNWTVVLINICQYFIIINVTRVFKFMNVIISQVCTHTMY